MKKSLALLAAAVLIGAGGVAIAQNGQTGQSVAAPASPIINPGYWDYTTRMLGIPVDHKKRCLKADEVEDFLTKPCNRHYTCVYPTKQVSNGKLLLEGYWQNKEGKRATVKANGTYQPKAFSIKASGSAIGGIPFMASMDAKWLGAQCPAGA